MPANDEGSDALLVLCVEVVKHGLVLQEVVRKDKALVLELANIFVIKYKYINFKRNWEMKLCKKRGVSKIRQMLDPFQNLIAEGLGPLGRNRSQEKCLCQESIGLLHQGHLPASAPGRKEASSQDCGSLSCNDSGDKKSEQAFLGSSCL